MLLTVVELVSDDGNLVTKRDGKVTRSTGPFPFGENASYRVSVTGQGSLLVELDGDDGTDVYRTVRNSYVEGYDLNQIDPEYSPEFDSGCNVRVVAKILVRREPADTTCLVQHEKRPQ